MECTAADSGGQREGTRRERPCPARKFNLSYSVSGVTRLLHRMGYSVQVPVERGRRALDHA
ncbi:winged helix-turn-helix domain-containing protein [Streptomyces sp. NPDC058676]|uniref:helix-turn-helix domain-containing protein n=1 Tax=unclassified Streptomyces TaxID=2593676 RepID=UPI00364AE57D